MSREAHLVVEATAAVRPLLRPDGPRVDLNTLSAFRAKIQNMNLGELGRECLKQITAYERDYKQSLFVIHTPISDHEFLMVLFVQAPKADNSYFEALIYRRFELPPETLKRFKSTAYPILIQKCTVGLDTPELLGFFGENVGEAGEYQKNNREAPAVYLVDRFADRFNRFTRVATAIGIKGDTFREFLKAARRADLTMWASSWLRRHEYFHQKGPLPYWKNQGTKGSRKTAGFEELRVDLLSILQLFSEGTIQSREIAHYVLLERLLVYPLVDINAGSKDPSFDSMGSLYLLRSLLDLGAIRLVDGQLEFASNWVQAIETLSEEMRQFELLLRTKAPKFRHGLLTEHLKEVSTTRFPELPCREMPGGFRLPEFYWNLSTRISDQVSQP